MISAADPRHEGAEQLQISTIHSFRNSKAITFGTVLRGARTRADLSQEALSFACEIDRTCVSLLERGKRQPTLATL